MMVLMCNAIKFLPYDLSSSSFAGLHFKSCQGCYSSTNSHSLFMLIEEDDVDVQSNERLAI